MFFPYFDFTYIILIPAIVFSVYAQSKVSMTFSRYSQVASSSGLTGAEVAERILRSNGIYDVRIERISSTLGDHYDPSRKVLKLSPEVYGSTSLAALGVAAHEAGHAIQHNAGYLPLQIRSGLVPVAQFGSMAAFPLILLGILISPFLLKAGIYAFTAVVLFHLITLPVEYNASDRAIALLEAEGFVSGSEALHTKKVLDAAALTYVAGALAALLSLVRLLLIARMYGGDE